MTAVDTKFVDICGKKVIDIEIFQCYGDVAVARVMTEDAVGVFSRSGDIVGGDCLIIEIDT